MFQVRKEFPCQRARFFIFAHSFCRIRSSVSKDISYLSFNGKINILWWTLCGHLFAAILLFPILRAMRTDMRTERLTIGLRMVGSRRRTRNNQSICGCDSTSCNLYFYAKYNFSSQPRYNQVRLEWSRSRRVEKSSFQKSSGSKTSDWCS